MSLAPRSRKAMTHNRVGIVFLAKRGRRGIRPGGSLFGRPRATTGPDFGNSVKVPDEIDVQRARQILDAIRKRLGNALSPEIERDYLERLLDMR